MDIVVVGAGKVGYYLVETLVSQNHRVAIIDKDIDKCTKVAKEFAIRTIHGDGTVLADLADAGADRADVLLAVTGKDEVNLIAAQLAKRKLGMRKAIARCNNPKNRVLFQKLGVDFTVSSTALIVELIEQEVASEKVRTLLTLHHGDLGLVEVNLPEDAPAAGVSVADLAALIPEGSVLVAIIRGDGVLIPRGNTILHAGDVVMALAHTRAAGRLRQALLGDE